MFYNISNMFCYISDSYNRDKTKKVKDFNFELVLVRWIPESTIFLDLDGLSAHINRKMLNMRKRL